MNVTEMLEGYIPRDKQIQIMVKELDHLMKLDVKKQFLNDSEFVMDDEEIRMTVADQYDKLMRHKETLKVKIATEELENIRIDITVSKLGEINYELGKVIRLKYIEGLSNYRIADLIDVAPRTIARKVNAAKKIIEKRLLYTINDEIVRNAS